MLDRPSPYCIQLIKAPVTTQPSADNTIYVYADVLWRKKSANTKILQKSTNFGVTWTDVYTFTDYIQIIVVTQDGSIIVGTKADNDVYGDTPGEIYRSGDSGSTFTKVLTYTSGGTYTFSFDVYQNTVYVAEYGKYNALYVYKSSDSGATWSTFFTHPVNGSSTCHIHKVHIDNITPTTVYVSYGDSAPAKGIQYTTDGSNWNVITTSHQPTWIETDATYVYFGEDLEGKINRIRKDSLALGDAAIETVYDSRLDTRGDFANVSFYGGGRDSFGNIYFAGVAYGENHSSNNKDSALLVSQNQGEDWIMLKSYDRQPTSSSGSSFLSKPTSFGRVYVKNNLPSIVQILDTRYINDRLKSVKPIFN